MSRTARWTQLAIATIVVYGFVPAALPAWRWLRGAAGSWSDYTALAMAAAVGALILLRSRAPWSRLGPARVFVVVTVAAIWAWGFTTATLTAAEKTHFVTYGVLAWFALRALELDVSAPSSFVLAGLLVGVLGWGEEVIQYYLPRRHFEWKDVGLNLLSGALALAAIGALRERHR